MDRSKGLEVKDYSTPVKLGISGVTAVAAGIFHSFALKKDGSVWCWGDEIGVISPLSSAQSYVIKPQFSYVKSFSEGLAFADGEFINQKGESIFRLPYSSYVYRNNVFIFHDGLAMVATGKDTGSIFGVTPYFGLIEKNGKEVVKPKYTSPIGEFHDGMAEIYRNDKFGFIDQSGKEVIKPQYDANGYDYEFREGLAHVTKGDKDGFINKTGKLIVPLKYFDAKNFSDGLALVSLKEKYGYINKSGKQVIKLQYDFASSFSEGLAVAGINGKLFLINKKGKRIKALKDYFIDEDAVFTEGMFMIQHPDYGMYGFINKSGKQVTKRYYDAASNFSEGLASVGYKNKYGFINKAGKEVIPLKYEFVADFNEGLALVKMKGKYGFIDKTGKVVIKPQFEEAESFSDGLAAVEVNGKWGYIANPLAK